MFVCPRPKRERHRPAIDPLFRTAAHSLSQRSPFAKQAMDAEHHASVIRTVLDRGVRAGDAAEALVVG
jgi:hypothetical protein